MCGTLAGPLGIDPPGTGKGICWAEPIRVGTRENVEAMSSSKASSYDFASLSFLTVQRGPVWKALGIPPLLAWFLWASSGLGSPSVALTGLAVVSFMRAMGLKSFVIEGLSEAGFGLRWPKNKEGLAVREMEPAR